MKNVSILADSLNLETGDRLTTFLLHRFPKCLQAQLNTHRALSRNSASSRAVPIKTMIRRVLEDPFIPTWTGNQRGMVGGREVKNRELAEKIWGTALGKAAHFAEMMSEINIHKQEANRLLEPFMRVPIIVSATEWDNFFTLRCDHAAQPDFQAIAVEMRELRAKSQPRELRRGEWHIPFIQPEDHDDEQPHLTRYLAKLATARCARVSYLTHDGKRDPAKDLELHDRLLADRHLSPFEHSAIAVPTHRPNGFDCRNYRGFYQYRSSLEDNHWEFDL